MKNLALLFAILFTISTNILAQGVGINSTNASADASAMLDVSSTTKGFLPPRMTSAQKTAISSPATGLLIYQTDGTSGLYYYNGSSWASFTSGTHYIGESYGGGIVFWVDATGQHGLIAAASDQSTGIQWYNGTNKLINAQADGIGAGKINTILIIALQTADNTGGSFAALVCAKLVITSGGVDYGDWYLPSKYELNLMYLQKTTIGGFASANYWSSDEANPGQWGFAGGWYQSFANGSQNQNGRSSTYYVRAIRSF